MAVRKTNNPRHRANGQANGHANGCAGEPAPARRVHWNETHRDLDRALARVLSPCEAVIVQRARELSYAAARMRGLAESLPFTIDLPALADYHKLSRQGVNGGMRRLLQSTILVKQADGMLRINKDYSTWKAPHSLSAEQVANYREGRFGLSLTPPETTPKTETIVSKAGNDRFQKRKRSFPGRKQTFPETETIVSKTEVPPAPPLLGREELEGFFFDPDPEKKRAQIYRMLRGHLAEDDE